LKSGRPFALRQYSWPAPQNARADVNRAMPRQHPRDAIHPVRLPATRGNDGSVDESGSLEDSESPA
jgi:hypothetical protein